MQPARWAQRSARSPGSRNAVGPSGDETAQLTGDGHAPIRDNGLAGHESPGARSQEHGDSAYVIGFSDATQWRLRFVVLENFGVLPQRTCEIRLHQTRRDA